MICLELGLSSILKSLSLAQALEELFELKRRPSRSLDLSPELQRNKDTARCGILGTHAGRGPRIALRTIDANLDFASVKNAHLFVGSKIWRGPGPLAPLAKILSVTIPFCSVLVLQDP